MAITGKLLVIDLDGRCNCRCVFCLKEDAILTAPRRTLAGTLTQIRQGITAGIDSVDFFGGEPTMYPFLKKAVVFTQRKGLKAFLATNAIAFSSKAYTTAFFKGLKPLAVRTTLHSHHADVHERITRTPGSWARTIKGIGHLLAANEQVTVNIVINRWNYRELVAWTRFLYGLGVRSVKYSALQHTGGALACEELWVGDKQYAAPLLKALRAASKLGFYFIELEMIPGPVVDKARGMKINCHSRRP
ncbi:MAG: radical SAM protein [Candidatus Omnitrophota bacterium]